MPPAPASTLVTPLVLANTIDIDNDTALNIARLLQSLDTDGNPNNGITIHNNAHTTAETMTEVDFSSSDFDTNNQIINLIADSGHDDGVTPELVSVDSARAHMEGSLNSRFTALTLNGKTFSVSSNNSEITFFELVFNTDGNGTIEFTAAPNEERDINSINWEVNGDTLSFRETDTYGDYWDWSFVIDSSSISDSTIVLNFDVSVTANEDGEEKTYTGFNVTLTHESNANEQPDGGSTGEPNAINLTNDLFHGKTFSVTSPNTHITFQRLTFNIASNSGTIKFSDVTNPITWSVDGGTLTFRETDKYDDYWDWVFKAASYNPKTPITFTFDASFTTNEDEGGSGSGYEVTLTHTP